MSESEFSIIERYFSQSDHQRGDVVLGIGDDGAIIEVPEGNTLVSTTDTLVGGVHFPLQTDPFSIGYKSLAVNLSDLAAMGAQPAWVSLALTLPEADTNWLNSFSKGFFELARKHNVALIGGDTTKGPLSVTVHALGLLPQGQALRRSGARPDDDIYLSGHIGDGALALKLLQDSISLSGGLAEEVMRRLNRPEPRVDLGIALRDTASAAIDVSDGLLADLGHILAASNVGAEIYLEQLPFSNALRSLTDSEDIHPIALASGDEYEILFTAPSHHQHSILARVDELNLPISRIGKILHDSGVKLLAHGQEQIYSVAGFDHFRKP